MRRVCLGVWVSRLTLTKKSDLIVVSCLLVHLSVDCSTTLLLFLRGFRGCTFSGSSASSSLPDSSRIDFASRPARRATTAADGEGAGTSSSLLMLLKPATETCGSLLAPFCSLFAPLSPSPELLFSLFFFCFCSLLKNRALEPVFLRSTIY